LDYIANGRTDHPWQREVDCYKKQERLKI
jgi:hypothetical protein